MRGTDWLLIATETTGTQPDFVVGIAAQRMQRALKPFQPGLFDDLPES
jgi:hypothetical protein